MVRQNQSPINLSIHQVIDRILESNQIGRQEHLQLTSAMLGDKSITDEERKQINRIFDQIQTGRIKIIEM